MNQTLNEAIAAIRAMGVQWRLHGMDSRGVRCDEIAESIEITVHICNGRHTELMAATLDLLVTVQSTLLSKDALLVNFPLEQLECLMPLLNPAGADLGLAAPARMEAERRLRRLATDPDAGIRDVYPEHAPRGLREDLRTLLAVPDAAETRLCGVGEADLPY